MDKESLNGRMEVYMKESFRIIIFMEKEFTNGLMAENTKVCGRIIRCMGMECLLGLIKEDRNMRETMWRTREKGSEYFTGLMVECTAVCGDRVNSREKERSRTLMEWR